MVNDSPKTPIVFDLKIIFSSFCFRIQPWHCSSSIFYSNSNFIWFSRKEEIETFSEQRILSPRFCFFFLLPHFIRSCITLGSSSVAFILSLFSILPLSTSTIRFELLFAIFHLKLNASALLKANCGNNLKTNGKKWEREMIKHMEASSKSFTHKNKFEILFLTFL